MSCGYQGMHFGAPYEDGGCIDGYLWDLDSCDENDQLTSGGEIPCPGCNRVKYMEFALEQAEEDGAEKAYDGKPCEVIGFRSLFTDDEKQKLAEAWERGWRQGVAECEEEMRDQGIQTI